MASVGPTGLAAAGLAIALASCSLDWDRLAPAGAVPVGGGGGSAAGGGGAGASGGGTTTGGGTAGLGGTGAVGGSGGEGGRGGGCTSSTDPLVSRGLVTRYFIDEAASGTMPTDLLDAAPDPLPLAITYAGGNGFSETLCQRGMSWPAISLDGRADVLVDGTKIESELSGSKTGTIECVFALEVGDPASSRISHIGVGSDSGRFTMFSDGATSLGLDYDDQAGMVASGPVEVWTVDLLGLGRLVAHLVVDTELPLGDDRVRLYVNGVDQGVGDIISSVMPKDSEMLIEPTDSYALGNRAIGNRSFQGTLYYCAMYKAALTPAEVQQNAERLLDDDDARP
jgi:hypothetical protein